MHRDHLTRKEHLEMDGLDVVKIAEKFDTPLYLTSANTIKEKYRSLYNALSSHYDKIRIHYACKANTNLAILNLLKQEGCWIDAVSKGEIYSALEAGFPSNKIMYTGTSVSKDELSYAVEKGTRINIDSFSELEKLVELDVSEKPSISFRVNPGMGAGHHDYVVTGGSHSKFGIWKDSVIEAYKKAKKEGFPIKGIHMHIGSGILEVDKFIPAVETLLDIAGKVHEKLDIEFKFIDFGGGLGVPYKPDDKPLHAERFGQKVASLFKEKISEYGLGTPYITLEPGRFLVAESTILLAKVNDVKENPYNKFVGIDAGFHTFVRPVMYNSYHEIVNASRNPEKEQKEKVFVVGPLCDSGDILGKERPLYAEKGDILAILDTGAYGFSMASRYNTRPIPAEAMVKNGNLRLIRRRETIKDLLEKQTWDSP